MAAGRLVLASAAVKVSRDCSVLLFPQAMRLLQLLLLLVWALLLLCAVLHVDPDTLEPGEY